MICAGSGRERVDSVTADDAELQTEVFTIERHSGLADAATALSYENVRGRCGDETLGWTSVLCSGNRRRAMSLQDPSHASRHYVRDRKRHEALTARVPL